MPTLTFQYSLGGFSWANLNGATLDHSLEELCGTEEVIINLPNTAANRSIISQNVYVAVNYDGYWTYIGLLTGADYTNINLQCKIYNPVYVALKQSPNVVNQIYNQVSANQILQDIVNLCTPSTNPFIPQIYNGGAPTTLVSIKFNNANPFDAVVALAKALGLHYWGNSSNIYIGTRDSNTYFPDPSTFEVSSKHGVDRSKQIGQVIIQGTDVNGVQIQGSAGSGGAKRVFIDQKVADVASLNTLAAYKLQLLNNPTTGTQLIIQPNIAARWEPGNYVTVTREDLALSGNYIIQRITKRTEQTVVEVDIAVNQDDVNLVETDEAKDQPAYTPQPSSIAPTTLSLQALKFLGHLTEGAGVIATDSSINGNNGAITNGSWSPVGWAPGISVLSFAGSGYITIPAAAFPVGGTSAFAVGGWFSPASEVTDGNYIASKTNQFRLSQYGTNGQIRFSVYIGGAWHDLLSDPGVAPVGCRGFALGVYDGSKMYLYVAPLQQNGGLLTYFQAQTGNIDAGSADVLLGNLLTGVISEQMLWARSLSAQEAQILYFFPLIESI